MMADPAVFILNLHNDGSVKNYTKLSANSSTTPAALHADLQAQTGPRFGVSLANLGDLNGDAVVDLAVGAPWHNEGAGAAFLLFLNEDGTAD